jgi:hypothetical protein
MSSTHRSDRDLAVAAVAILREIMVTLARPSIARAFELTGRGDRVEAWAAGTEALHAELSEPLMVVEFCAWCPEPKAPRREFHPDGTGRHVEGSFRDS